ncbi:hypothetical protein M378DRAFT_155708, partial [Amanita muscaria Koide BX008]
RLCYRSSDEVTGRALLSVVFAALALNLNKTEGYLRPSVHTGSRKHVKQAYYFTMSGRRCCSPALGDDLTRTLDCVP